jgi:DNA-3-methyladenine glycosylase II
MQNSNDLKLRFNGSFSLSTSVRVSAASSFVEDLQMDSDNAQPVLDLAFSVEGDWGTVGIRVAQHDTAVIAQVVANPGGTTNEAISAQLERMLSLDVDASRFGEIIANDKIVELLERLRPGLRPVLYPSPYEAAARAIIGHRLFVRQAASVSGRVSLEHGEAVMIAGRLVHAFPSPERLASLTPVEGLSDRKVSQLRALGTFTVKGGLDSVGLRSMKYPEALTYLQQLKGIGPFSAELIMLRGVGDSDAFPCEEKRLHRAMALAYKLEDSSDLNVLLEIAERWRPYRSWVGLLLRNSTFALSP